MCAAFDTSISWTAESQMGVTFANPQMVAKIWRGISGPNIVNWQKQKHYAFKQLARLPLPLYILNYVTIFQGEPCRLSRRRSKPSEIGTPGTQCSSALFPSTRPTHHRSTSPSPRNLREKADTQIFNCWSSDSTVCSIVPCLSRALFV